jgi:pantothenate kinase type III
MPSDRSTRRRGAATTAVQDWNVSERRVEVVWPDAVPHAKTDFFMTILCGNSRYNWALHEGEMSQYAASVYWRYVRLAIIHLFTHLFFVICHVLSVLFVLNTHIFPFVNVHHYRTSTLTVNELNDTVDPCGHLERYLPGQAQVRIYGSEDGPHTRAEAVRQHCLSRIPYFNVYVVSTNDEHMKGIEYMLQDLPCRIYFLKATDFMDASTPGFYPEIGIDRVANLKAAVGYYGLPSLVIDGGTALTYTALDTEGNLLGGGITPGVDLCLASLHGQADALPYINPADLSNRINQCEASGTPMSTWGNSVEKAILAGVWREKRSFLRSIIAAWEDRVKDSIVGKDPAKFNTQLKVCLTGGDAPLLEKLLKTNDLLDPIDGEFNLTNDQVVMHKHLSHFGIVALFRERMVSDEQMDATERVRNEVLGQRVAKDFHARPDEDSETIYRGTISWVDRGKTYDDDLYKIDYDDGDQEELNVLEIYGMCCLHLLCTLTD